MVLARPWSKWWSPCLAYSAPHSASAARGHKRAEGRVVGCRVCACAAVPWLLVRRASSTHPMPSRMQKDRPQAIKERPTTVTERAPFSWHNTAAHMHAVHVASCFERAIELVCGAGERPRLLGVRSELRPCCCGRGSVRRRGLRLVQRRLHAALARPNAADGCA